MFTCFHNKQCFYLVCNYYLPKNLTSYVNAPLYYSSFYQNITILSIYYTYCIHIHHVLWQQRLTEAAIFLHSTEVECSFGRMFGYDGNFRPSVDPYFVLFGEIGKVSLSKWQKKHNHQDAIIFVLADFAKTLRMPTLMVRPASLRIYKNSTVRYATQ